MKYLPRKHKITIRETLTKKKLHNLYIKKHLTMQEIANLFNCTKRYINNLIQKNKINTKNAEKFEIKCNGCGIKYIIERSKWRKNKKHYHSNICYHSNRIKNNMDKKEKKMYLNIARSNYEIFYNEKLKSTDIIHHIDGDITNNKKENLMKFDSQSEHLKFHHNKRINSKKEDIANEKM